MSYQLLTPYKCVKCGHEFKYSRDHTHGAPVIAREEETDRGTFTHHMPACPKCWEDFIQKNIGLGYCTESWSKEGSDYDKSIKSMGEQMKTIIEMAREAKAEFAELAMMDAIVFSVDDKEWNSAELKRFVELVRADEREACVKVCDELLKEDGNWTPTGHRFATAIRARGNT